MNTPTERLTTQQIRELAGHASIGEPVVSIAEAAGWQIIDHLPEDQRAQLLALIDDGKA